MKTIWQGSLSFGLVTIPVRLYSAVKEHAIGFTLLCKKCHEPIVYERWCKHCKKQVAWQDVVKGLKLPDGSYFILTQEKLKALKPHKTNTIDVVEFVDASQIEPIYLEHHFYLAPEHENEKSFFLLKKVLEDAGKVAIATFVMRDKQYVCMINSYKNILLLSTLNYTYEIRSLQEIKPLKQEIKKFNPAELKLAKQLVDQLTVKKFDVSKFKDTFLEELAKAIKQGKKEKIAPQKAKRTKITYIKSQKENSLIAGLKASLIAPSRSSQSVAYARAARKR
jgi:DNA end-binding protein Ku